MFQDLKERLQIGLKLGQLDNFDAPLSNPMSDYVLHARLLGYKMKGDLLLLLLNRSEVYFPRLLIYSIPES